MTHQPTNPLAGDGCTPAHQTSTPCPISCPDDFDIIAHCRIIKTDGGSIQISAEDILGDREIFGYSAGTFTWTTSSSKIRLRGADSSTRNVTGQAITVEARSDPSSARDAETITVTRTADGCPPIVKTVSVTVAKVTFSESGSNNRYGYDNFDTAASADDHVCVKSGGNTSVHVEIEGGLVGTDFNFTVDDAGIEVEPQGASASFDLRLNANVSTAKLDTALHARCRCAAATSFASIALHVYREKRVEVIIAKIGTNLRLPNADYASHEGTANDKLKQAVVMYDMSNFDPGNGVTRVHYDLDGNRALSYDINANGGGAELDAIRRAMTVTGRKVRVAIVREMKSYYYLDADAPHGQTWVTVRGGSVFNYPVMPINIGRPAHDGFPANEEQVTVVGHAGNRVNFSAGLTNDHRAGDPLEFPALGWGSDPIIVVEGNLTEDAIKWVICHEVGHVGLELKDVDDINDLMNWQHPPTDYRLRYCPRTKKHEAGTENQWDTVPR